MGELWPVRRVTETPKESPGLRAGSSKGSGNELLFGMYTRIIYIYIYIIHIRAHTYACFLFVCLGGEGLQLLVSPVLSFICCSFFFRLPPWLLKSPKWTPAHLPWMFGIPKTGQVSA